MEDLGTEGRKPSKIFASLCVLTLSAPILLASCSMGWFGEGAESDEEPLESRYPIEDDEYPNLGNVPEAPPESSSEEERAATVESLEADRENAATEETGSEEDPVATRIASDSDSLEGQSSNAAAGAVTELAAGTGDSASLDSEPELDRLGPESTAANEEMLDAAQTASIGNASDLPPARSEIAAVIYFGHGSTVLNENDREVLRGVAALQRRYDARLRVIGHASSRTDVSSAEVHRIANFNASLRRASRVGGALVEMGVDPELVTTEARSDSEPVYLEVMPTGEAGNRRVEIYLEY